MWNGNINPVTGQGASAGPSKGVSATLINTRVNRYAQYCNTDSSGVIGNPAPFEEISLDYDSISLSGPAASPGTPS
jgi:hypothetical protein